MDEFSKIIILEYCNNHKSMKSKFFYYLLKCSEDLAFCPSDEDVILLEKYIDKETDEELRDSLEELLDFLVYS